MNINCIKDSTMYDPSVCQWRSLYFLIKNLIIYLLLVFKYSHCLGYSHILLENLGFLLEHQHI